MGTAKKLTFLYWYYSIDGGYMAKQWKLEFVQFDNVFRDNQWMHQIIELDLDFLPMDKGTQIILALFRHREVSVNVASLPADNNYFATVKTWLKRTFKILSTPSNYMYFYFLAIS